MASIFPFIQPAAFPSAAEEQEVYRDVKWDFAAGRPVCVRGEPVIVSGLPAVMSWAWRALRMERFLHVAYSWDYGNEIQAMIGQQWLPETKIAEAARYTKECLLQNPHITDVRDIKVGFADGMLSVSARLETVYGSDMLEVTYV